MVVPAVEMVSVVDSGNGCFGRGWGGDCYVIVVVMMVLVMVVVVLVVMVILVIVAVILIVL